MERERRWRRNSVRRENGKREEAEKRLGERYCEREGSKGVRDRHRVAGGAHE